MTVQTYTVSRVMSDTLFERGVLNGFVRGFIDFVACYSGTEFFESCVLSVQHGLETPFGSRAGLSDNQGSFKLARVASHLYSGLRDKNISSTNFVLSVDRVGNRRVGTHLPSEASNHWGQRYFHLDIGLSEFLEHSSKCIVARSDSYQSIMKTGASILEQNVVS